MPKRGQSAKRSREEEEGNALSDSATNDVSAENEQPKKKIHRRDTAMPDSFKEKLGTYDDPEEAKGIEDIVFGHCEFEDLSDNRKTALFKSVRSMVKQVESDLEKIKSKQSKRSEEGGAVELSEGQRHQLVHRFSRLENGESTARKSELIGAYRRLVREGEVQPSTAVEELLMKKKGKSHSGVLVVTVLMGPGQFSCPKDCHYCPNQPGIARSYLLKEPGVLRGFRNKWDPIQQFYDRASALENNGHVVDKIEIIILGGTFSFYPKDYVEDFISATFYAANTYYASQPVRVMNSLQEEITENETAKCRIIGLTIETRPDYITKTELKRFRELGVTRVQIGIQHLDDEILDFVNRECPTSKTISAIQRLLDGGFKVDAHWMPDLPSSSYEKDMDMFRHLLSEDNVNFQVDQWKVYPTMTVPFTKIKEWYDEGKYKPYAEEQQGALMVKLLIYIMANCPYRLRLNRIVRDIPNSYICGGENRVNLRQVLEKEMKQRNIVCKDIRERECKGKPLKVEDSQMFVDEFRASDGTEYYISIEDTKRTALYGHLRLRIRDDSSAENSLFPALTNAALIRELHTYGKLVAHGSANTGRGEAQHAGVGSRLMAKAEEIAMSKGLHKTVVIAGVGVRKYYEKLGYGLEDTYMTKQLTAKMPGEESMTPRSAAAAVVNGTKTFLKSVYDAVMDAM